MIPLQTRKAKALKITITIPDFRLVEEPQKPPKTLIRSASYVSLRPKEFTILEELQSLHCVEYFIANHGKLSTQYFVYKNCSKHASHC